MQLVVRERTDADLEQVIGLLAASFAHDKYPTRWPASPADFLTPASMFGSWVVTPAEQPDLVLGHMVLVPVTVESGPETEAEVSRLMTHRQYRGSGMGKALLNHAVLWAQQHKRRLSLQVVEGTSAVGFYESSSWQYLDTVDAYWVLDDGTRPRMRRYQAPLRLNENVTVQ